MPDRGKVLWSRWGGWIALMLVLTGLLSPGWNGGLLADDAAPKTPAAAPVDTFGRVLAGGSPTNLADLKALQQRVQGLTEKLIQTTVGVQVGAAQGSGVIISKDGYVLTAAHVSGQVDKDVIFFLTDGRVLKGKTLGMNRTLDAGMMKITEGGDFPFVELGASNFIKEGQWCLATGHPGGYQADRKPVLRLGRILLQDETVITTDCTLVGGDSGGPLFDLDGRVIGINSRISSSLQSNMHVPVNTFRDTWDRLVRNEAWGYPPGHEPYVGITGDADAKEAKIAKVKENSPAAKAGLQVGDIVLAVDGKLIPTFQAFVAAIQDHQPSDKIKLQFKRGAETIELTLEIGLKGR